MNAQTSINLKDKINMNSIVLQCGEGGHTSNIRRTVPMANRGDTQEKTNQLVGPQEEQDWRAGLFESGPGRWLKI